MSSLFPIVYAGNLAYYAELKKAVTVIFDKHEHYVKQTYRNRCTIYGANGKLDLIIPIEKGKNGHQHMQDVRISYASNWQRLHWKSLESAYRTSPYFEFYEHEFAPFYEAKTTYLIDYNLSLHEKIFKLLQLGSTHTFSERYLVEGDGITDFRSLADPQVKTEETAPYTQVFETRHGFIPNLSIFDALFNCGPETINLF